MLALIAAALVSTNVSRSAEYLNAYVPGDVAWTNQLGWASAVAETVRNRCVVDREITCPACNNTSTQQVDITDVYTHYEGLRSIDLRCYADMARMGDELRKASRETYVSGYTDALMVITRALRKPCKACALARAYSVQELKLMSELADIFEEAAKKAVGVGAK